MITIEKIEATCETIINCGFEEVINCCDASYETYREKLEEAYLVANKNQEMEKSHAFYLLSLACSPMLNPSDVKSPFQEFAIISNSRTIISADFTKEQCELFSELSLLISDPELAARIADLAWVTKKDINAARIAIQHYISTISSPYCKNHWSDRVKRLERALRIAIQINETSQRDIIKDILLEHIDPNHESYALPGAASILQILMDLKLLDNISIAEKAVAFANQANQPDSPLISLDFATNLYLLADTAFTKAKDNRSQDARLNIAETHLKKARTAASNIVAAHFISQAIAVLLTCKNQKKRIDQLKREQVEMNMAARAEMQRYSTTIDLNPLIEIAIEAIKGKELTEALYIFSEIAPILSMKKLKQHVLEISKNNPLTYIAEKPMLNRSGKISAIIPPLLHSEGKEKLAALNAACYQQADFYYKAHVNGLILPALHTLKEAHAIDARSLYAILQHSPMIPRERKNLWIKGLLAGFNGEFDVALHLLIPQFENSLRMNLEAAGEIVWNVVQSTKIHTEMSFKQLLDLPAAKKLLGDDLHFNLKCLLIERSGFNVRNDALHGLMEEAEFYSPFAIYIWWLLFHIAMKLPSGS